MIVLDKQTPMLFSFLLETNKNRQKYKFTESIFAKYKTWTVHHFLALHPFLSDTWPLCLWHTHFVCDYYCCSRFAAKHTHVSNIVKLWTKSEHLQIWMWSRSNKIYTTENIFSQYVNIFLLYFHKTNTNWCENLPLRVKVRCPFFFHCRRTLIRDWLISRPISAHAFSTRER